MFLVRRSKPWKAAVVYYNPNDPRIVVPNRFRVGWTLNMASPWSWALTAGFVAAMVYSWRVSR